MRLSKRAKVQMASGLAIIILAAAAIAYGTAQTRAASNSVSASYTGTYGSLAPASAAHSVPTNVQPNLAVIACTNDTDIPSTGTCTHTGPDAAAKAGPAVASRKPKPAPDSPFNRTAKANSNTKDDPHVGDSSEVKQGAVIANFNGISDVSQRTATGFHITPPDQALCVGRASALQGAGVPLAVPGNSEVIVEGVNDAWEVYSTSGAMLFGPDNLTNLFSDPNASGDITCKYDAGTQTFFFGEIGVLSSGPDINNYGTDLAVLNSKGYAPYQVDTSVGGNCFPDFPQQGYDNHAVYITINEFCGASGNFAGANVYGLSKSQLVAEGSVNTVTFGPLALSNDPVLALQPSFGDESGTEYLVNSWPFDQFGNSNSITNTLGLWQVNGDKNITSGTGTVTLLGRNISSETYGFPQPAASSGTGAVTCQHSGTPPPCVSPNFPVTSEAFLNPDDSRAEQAQLINTEDGPRLYTSLTTALTIGTDPSARDGAAWFEIDPTAHKVTRQGYVSAAGTYLIYPSIMRSHDGTVVIDFSLTSPTLNPSTGYVVMKNGNHSFGPIKITGAGSAPHVSFSDLSSNPRPRWGDYSAAALSLDSNNIWVADEYIPPAPDGADVVDNWGTRVWGVSGND